MFKEVFAYERNRLYNALLHGKMKAEQGQYKDWLLTRLPEEILNDTYEYTMREDFVMCKHIYC